jgi:hypothetical protein
MVASQRRIAALCLALSVMVVGGLLQAVDLKAEPLMEWWLDGHLGRLPDGLEEFRSIPPKYRPVVARHLTPELRGRLWRQQMAEMLERKDLTERQREHILSMLVHVQPVNYVVPLTGAAKAAVGRLCQAMPGLFPSASDRALFLTLAPAEGRSRRSWRTLPFVALALVHKLNEIGTVSAADCDCHQGSSCLECEGIGGIPAGCPCTAGCTNPKPSGCGCDELQSCNDHCLPPEGI